VIVILGFLGVDLLYCERNTGERCILSFNTAFDKNFLLHYGTVIKEGQLPCIDDRFVVVGIGIGIEVVVVVVVVVIVIVIVVLVVMVMIQNVEKNGYILLSITVGIFRPKSGWKLDFL